MQSGNSRSASRLAVLLGVFFTLATAQINTGKITGFITDPSGAFVTDVSVRATNEATGVSTTTRSSSTGEYLINFLVPGPYRVEAEHAGFQKSIQTSVQVNAGGISHADFSLNVGELRQTVEVAANPLAVNTETSELPLS